MIFKEKRISCNKRGASNKRRHLISAAPYSNQNKRHTFKSVPLQNVALKP